MGKSLTSKKGGTGNPNSNKNRTHLMTPKAGVTKSRRRYGEGGYCE